VLTLRQDPLANARGVSGWFRELCLKYPRIQKYNDGMVGRLVMARLGLGHDDRYVWMLSPANAGARASRLGFQSRVVVNEGS
jgi:hypothetical protein